MLKRNLLASATALAMVAVLPAQATIFDRDVTLVKSLTPAGDGFAAELAREYRQFSLFESEQMYDWPDADRFAEKAMAASNGNAPSPERPENWRIGNAAALGELQAARGQLIAALDDNAATRAPHEAAVAQVKYDCWVEQQEEGWQDRHIAACKRDFELAMDKLAKAMEPEAETRTQPLVSNSTPVEPEAKTLATVTPIAKKIPVTTLNSVYFDFDKATLTPEARQAIDTFADSIENKDEVEVVVTGHADRAGPSDYNVKLSERRAMAVRDRLLSRGVRLSELSDFDLRALGENSPAVATADGVAEPANRRVVLFGLGYAEATQLGELNQ
mgnify:CR=1 FL=1